MKSWKILKKELLKDKEVLREYEKLKPKYLLVSQLIEARIRKGMSQEQLAKKIGTKQSAIARVESGNANPSINFLEKLTQALGSKLIIKLQG